MNVAETLVVHGFGSLCFVDAATGIAGDPTSQTIIDEFPVVQFSPVPRHLTTIAKRGCVALTFEEASLLGPNADRSIPELPEPPPAAPLALAGIARATTDRWLPRLFSVSLERGSSASVALYRSPVGTAVGVAGALIARLANELGAPIPWAIATLTVSIPPSGSVVCEAQSDAFGDLILPLRRLSAPPKGVADYGATLSVRWHPGATANSPVDPTTAVSASMVPPQQADAVTSMMLRVAPGTRQRLVSFNNQHAQLVVKP